MPALFYSSFAARVFRTCGLLRKNSGMEHLFSCGAQTCACAPRPLSSAYLQPEQEEQQSAEEQQLGEEQQLVRSAAATLATPSVMTAINSITFNFLMIFLLFLNS